MVQGYYTLEEAAQILGMGSEALKEKAQRNEIRSFQDRGTWRFRIQDIQELARQRGQGSDPDLALGESPRTPQPKSGVKGPPTPAPKSPRPDMPRAEMPRPEMGGPKSDPKKVKPGSDSDVKLVAEGDAGFAIGDAGAKAAGSDSDVKLVDSDVKMVPEQPRTPPSGQRKSGIVAPSSPVPKKGPPTPKPAAPDSGVRLVPMDSDSDVKIVGAAGDEVPLGEGPAKQQTDSDIRLEATSPPPGRGQQGALTEEIDLDAELQRQETQKKPQAKVKAKGKQTQTSPFELSESSLDLPPVQGQAKTPKPKPESSDYPLSTDSSSDFDIQLTDDSSDEHLQLGEEGKPLKGHSSGINLAKPGDSGISLEHGKGGDEIEFELGLDAAAATPKPAKPKKDDSDSEFELSLDVEDSSAEQEAMTVDSDSEFELALDDSGERAKGAKPQAKGKGKEKDIFETDFEAPPSAQDSDSQVAALQTDLDSSDFDLALSDSDIAVEDESGSQVVALDEEEAEEGAATVAARRKGAPTADYEAAEDVAELDTEAEAEEAAAAGVVREVVRKELVQPAPWGALPVLCLLPCVVIMLLVGIMGLELVQTGSGFKPAGFLTKMLGNVK